MPAYNCEPFIKQAIDSILNQTHVNFEFLICDDASEDNTWGIIDSYTDERIRKFRNEQNIGLLGNYNFLLSQVKGDYVTCQDADDWSEITRLEEQLEVFENIKDIHLVGCNGTFYYDSGTSRKCPEVKTGYIDLEREVFPFILPAALFKRDVLEHISGFHPYFNNATSMDQYFFFNILSKFKGYVMNRYLYTARFNYNSNTRNLTNFRKATAHEAYLLLRRQRIETGSDWIMENKIEQLLEYEQSFLHDRTFMAEKFREYAVYKMDGNFIGSGYALLLKAFLKNPFYIKLYRTAFYGLRKVIKLS